MLTSISHTSRAQQLANVAPAYSYALNAVETSGHSNKRWVAHVSSDFRFKARPLVLNIKPSKQVPVFDVVSGLLSAKTCQHIIINAHLSLSEFQILKHMAVFSGTRLSYVQDANDYKALFSRRAAQA